MNDIPQNEWEKYVAIRDKIKYLEGLPLNDSEADKEYGRLHNKLLDFHSRYDYYALNERYKDSLKKYNKPADKECVTCKGDGWTAYGPCQCTRNYDE